MPRDERGFTLIELLLVSVIMIIIGSLGVKTYYSIEKMQLMMTANNIRTLIRNTQEISYKEESTNLVAFDYSNGECNHIRNARVLNGVKMPPKVKMHKTNFTNGRLYFRGKLSPNMGGTLVLSSKLYSIKMTVMPVTGRVKVYPVNKK